uniref:Uncharacterized protein n=1 Tax=Desulfobacca acetoxidans TaxID=60893 RepID=A0A7C5ALD3_9BACT
MTEIDPQQIVFELREVTEQLRKFPTDSVVCGVVGSVLERARKIKLYSGHPLERELREAVAELCFAFRDWWRGPGELIFGPDIAHDQAKIWEIAGNLWTMTVKEVAEHSLTRHIPF